MIRKAFFVAVATLGVSIATAVSHPRAQSLSTPASSSTANTATSANQPADNSVVVDPSHIPPWIDPGDIPLIEGVQSVVARHDDVPVFEGPSANTKRRGTLAPHVPVPLFAMHRAEGCAGRWAMVGPLAWVCQDGVTLSKTRPVGIHEVDYRSSENGLLYQYYRVGARGAWGYGRLRSVDIAVPEQSFEPGFFIAADRTQAHNGESYVHTTRGLWVALRDLTPASPSSFRGVQVSDGKLDFAWVYKDKVTSFVMPGRKKAASLERLQRLAILERQTSNRKTILRIDDNVWVNESDVRMPTTSAPPSGVAAGERWIDVHLASQTLVAYQGDRPVYATMVSTGRGRAGSGLETPVGEYKIWVKLLTSNMGNVEQEAGSELYSIEDVPYVQFFHRGVGLHGTLWHDRFGTERSHGCVNLSSADARWLFDFTGPRLPAGWRAVLPSQYAAATVVRVR